MFRDKPKLNIDNEVWTNILYLYSTGYLNPDDLQTLA